MMKRLRCRKGQGMSEYLIVLALVVIASVGSVIYFADNLKEMIANLAQEISGEAAVVEHKADFAEKASTSYGLANFTDSNDP